MKFKVRKLTSIKEKLTLIDRESPGVRFKSKVGQAHFENNQSGPGPLWAKTSKSQQIQLKPRGNELDFGAFSRVFAVCFSFFSNACRFELDFGFVSRVLLCFVQFFLISSRF